MNKKYHKLIIGVLILWLIFSFSVIAFAEKINDHCYKYDGVLICEEEKKEIIPSFNIEKAEPQKEEEIIIKTSWEKVYSDQTICDAIYIIEGKKKARQPFGIETIECKTFDRCEQVCLNTVRNNRKRYDDYGFKEYGTYLEFLASRYCPPNQEKWLEMLNFYLEKM